eukprot:5370674-Pleurochrysis_carterae.AAC.1
MRRCLLCTLVLVTFTLVNTLVVVCSARFSSKQTRGESRRPAPVKRLWDGSEKKWTHKSTTLSSPERGPAGWGVDSANDGFGDGGVENGAKKAGRGRAGKRTAFYLALKEYAEHFSRLIRREWQAEQVADRSTKSGSGDGNEALRSVLAR